MSRIENTYQQWVLVFEANGWLQDIDQPCPRPDCNGRWLSQKIFKVVGLAGCSECAVVSANQNCSKVGQLEIQQLLTDAYSSSQNNKIVDIYELLCCHNGLLVCHNGIQLNICGKGWDNLGNK